MSGSPDEVLTAYARLGSAARTSISDAVWDGLVEVVSGSLSLPLPPPPPSGGNHAPGTGTDAAGPSGRERLGDATRRFAEQFVVDVAGMPDDVRAGFLAEQGDEAFPVAQVIWVLDWTSRIEAAWPQLGLVDRLDRVDRLDPHDPPTGGNRAVGSGAVVVARDEERDTSGLWGAIDAFLAAVARLDAVDPVTTELVRLRGARTHDCRLCRSRRYVRALDAGADETTFDLVDDYEHSRLDERTKVALRLVDALIWTPARHPDGLADQVAAAFNVAERLELVLDVMRNAANKLAVAFGADAAEVPEGQVDYYDLDPDGQVHAGLSRST